MECSGKITTKVTDFDHAVRITHLGFIRLSSVPDCPIPTPVDFEKFKIHKHAELNPNSNVVITVSFKQDNKRKIFDFQGAIFLQGQENLIGTICYEMPFFPRPR